MAFDDVTPSVQPKPLRPDRQSAQQGHSPDGFVAGNVGLFVDTFADHGVLIGPAPPLNRLQCRPAVAIEVVVEEREREGIGRCQKCHSDGHKFSIISTF